MTELILSLPELSPESPEEFEIAPAKISKWLDSLPMLNASEAGHELHKKILMSNRTELDYKDRLKFLELLQEPVDAVCDKLQKTYNGLPLPLPDKGQLTAEQVRHFQVEMAYGYKHVVNDIYEKRGGKISGRHAARVALPIHRAIRYLAKVLVHSFQFYAPYPLGTWREIHSLHSLADGIGVTNEPIEDPLNKYATNSSVDQVYKQALLMDLSDPYHLPSQMIPKVYKYLDCAAALSRLDIANSEHVRNTCQFLIDMRSDRAGNVYLGEPGSLDSNNMRLLSTMDLARSIHAQITELEKGQLPESTCLEKTFFDQMTKEMLIRLINSWGVNPKRVFSRTASPGEQVYTVIGLDAVRYFLCREKPFSVSANTMGPWPQRTRLGTFFARPDLNLDKPTDEGDRVTYKHTIWDVLDESAGGLALETNGKLGHDLRIGEVIATKAPGSKEDWVIGSIRWMRHINADQIEIGIQRLAPMAIPLALKTVDSVKGESEFMPALLLPEIKALKYPTTLLTPRGTHKSNDQIYIDDGMSLRRIQANQLVEMTGSYERFSFNFPDYKTRK